MIKREILKALQLSSLIYKGEDFIKKADLELIRFFSDKGTDTQGAILADHDNKNLFIVFRGTESKRDILIDVDIWQDTTYFLHNKCKVHNGFLTAYDSIRLEIDITPFEQYYGYTVIICGHSLGGALATICGASLHILNKKYIVTFGSPRVGDKRFANIVNNDVEEYLRFVNNYDIVASVPNINYKHAGREIRLNDKGEEISYFNIFKRLIYWIKGGQKFDIASIKDHYMDNYTRVVSSWAVKEKK